MSIGLRGRMGQICKHQQGPHLQSLPASPINHKPCHVYCRTIKWFGLEGPLTITLVQPPAKAGTASTRGGCSELHPAWPWALLGVAQAQFFWVTRARASLPSQRRGFLYSWWQSELAAPWASTGASCSLGGVWPCSHQHMQGCPTPQHVAHGHLQSHKNTLQVQHCWLLLVADTVRTIQEGIINHLSPGGSQGALQTLSH